MLPEYLRYWGFSRGPFSLSPDPGMLYMSSQHQEALLRLKYGVLSNRGGVLLVSENAGDGKTSILRRLMDDLEVERPGRMKVAFIDHPTLTVNQMIAEIARQLGVPRVRKEKIDNLNALRTKLLAMHEEGIHSLVIVDEGQMLAHRPDLLQELRILLNFCVSEAFLLSFILSGQRPLEDALKKMPEFWQRLPVRFFLRNLDPKDTAALIRFRVRTAGQTEREIFTPTAIEGIHRASQGCPRVICSVADLSLLVGHSLRSPRVDFREVSQALNDMGRSGEPYHYYSFLASSAAEPPAAAPPPSQNAGRRPRSRRRQCPSCRRFVKAADQECARCHAPLSDAVPTPPSPPTPTVAAPDKVRCPGCLESVVASPRCASCGLAFTQACPRCQQPNPLEGGPCSRCGCPLTSREAFAAREFERGLRRLGIPPIAADIARRFPALESEGRVYVGWVASRLPWGRRSRLQTWDKVLEGSLFVTDRGLVFTNGAVSRHIGYRDIRKLSINPGERAGSYSEPRLRITLDQEEVRLAFPVATEKPSEFASLVSSFVANKRKGSIPAP
jgi:type II secretory pathway predicted ATPase ExeA